MKLIWGFHHLHYCDIIMGTMASHITSLTTVYSTVYSDADQMKHQSSASLVFVWGIHRAPVNSPHKWPVTRKMFPFDDVIELTGRSVKHVIRRRRVLATFGALDCQRITLCPAWISDYINHKVQYEFNYPSPNCSGANVDVWEWINKIILQFIGYVITNIGVSKLIYFSKRIHCLFS